jgi:hypothetical protein
VVVGWWGYVVGVLIKENYICLLVGVDFILIKKAGVLTLMLNGKVKVMFLAANNMADKSQPDAMKSK